MKQFKNYVIFWIVSVGLFNLCCFITPSEWYGISKYSGSFWVGYVFVMASFALHIVYAYFAFSEKSRQKQVLNTPLTIISFFELGLMIVVSILCMVVPALPYWLGIILCYIVLAFSVVFMVTAKAVGENVIGANVTLNSNTSYMRELADNAQALVSSASAGPAREIVTKVYEAIRYSDTVSSDETREDELAISHELENLRAFINNSELEELRHKADEVLQMIEKRNNKCKAAKRRI